MKPLPTVATGLYLLWLTSTPGISQDVLINEIMYHPPHAEDTREPVEEEFLELYNPGASTADISGWQLTRGVTFTFPTPTIIPAGGFLAVAADPATFATKYPSVTNVVGGWIGKLSNSSETIQLEDDSGQVVDTLTYADDGDWSVRERGPLDRGHQGWIWNHDADGGGRSLELVSPSLPNGEGQNWMASQTPGGTPGSANSRFRADSPPLITGTAHSPVIPRAADPVTISCRLLDESAGSSASVFYRIDDAAPFTQLSMAAAPLDPSAFSAVIPGHAHNTVVEFYVAAQDAGGLSRTWPPPALPSGLQETNALYQVDDSYDPNRAPTPGTLPTIRIVMTEAERAELAQIGSTSNQADSNARMNCTFVSDDGTVVDVRYRSSIRNRGASSRFPPPNNHLVTFPSSHPWNGMPAVKFNARNPHSQVAGAYLFRRFGIETADTLAVQLRVNGANLAISGSPMFGRYAMVEPLGSEFAQNHFPTDPDGNLYQIRDDESMTPSEEGELQYEGTDQNAYRNTYFKQTNSAEDDFSDLVTLTDVLNNAPADGYLEAVASVANLDQWIRYFAVESFFGNREGGLPTGKGDDYLLYRGIDDPSFRLVPHDLDTLGIAGVTRTPNQSIFGYPGIKGFERLFADPEFLARYYTELLFVREALFRPEIVFPILDDSLGSWVSGTQLANAKGFLAERTAGVLAQIPRTYSATSNLPRTPEGYHRTNTGAAILSGTFHAAFSRSVLVNGIPATTNQRTGTWNLDVLAGDAFFSPGLNYAVIQYFSEPSGGGNLLHTDLLDVWNNTGISTPVSGVLSGNPAAGEPRMTVRSSYLPGVPILVRVELRNPDGTLNKDVWDATASLTSNRPDLTLTPNSVTLYNGRGSALVAVSGGSGSSGNSILLPRGSTWRYLDDGSNQGIAWRSPTFDDSSWASGPAVLGYGDNQTTIVGFIDTDPTQNGAQKNATTYFRSTFDSPDPSSVASLSMGLRYDDGAIVYINGIEVAVTPNLTSGAAFDAFTDGDTPSETTYFNFNVPPSVLVAGTNSIAAEIHQGDDRSSDISFDLELTAGAFASDPGDFTLIASVAGRGASKAIASLASATPTGVAGTLPGTSTNWSGIIHVTGDVTVPAGHTLTVAPGTLVLLDGDSIPGSTAGTDIIVQGTLESLGTEAAPVTFTSSDPATTWGEIRFSNSAPSTFTYSHVHRAGHSPRGGHTNRGRVIRILGSDVTFEDSTITDNFGKVGESNSQSGTNSRLTIRRCHLGRSVMGFETTNTEVLLEDTHLTDMLGFYREDGVVDDDDAFYLHAAGAGQTLVLRGNVVANTDDDGIDTLRAIGLVIEDHISRDCFDKGYSMLGGTSTIRRSLFADNDIGISIKNDGHATLDHVTIAANSAIGLQVENKNGNDAPSFPTVTNSIVVGPDPIRTDYAPDDITFNFCILGEPWNFAGSANNLGGDPLLAAPASGDFRLSAASPAIDAGDPAAPPDPDGTRNDIGAYPYSETVPGSSEVVWTPAGGPYHLTADTTVPQGVTLVIAPGTSVFVDPGVELAVRGSIRALGTPEDRIRFSPPPGSPFVPNPAGNGGLPDGPPRWAGIRLIDSMSPDNLIAHLDVGYAQDSLGAIGIIRSQCVLDDISFHGTHFRMLYTDSSSIILQNSTFPDMFAPGEEAAALGLDNVSEHVKGIGVCPIGGRYIVRHNTFGTNKGHNDVIDVDSARRSSPNPIVQIIGNTFAGSRDELLDLGGDVYVEGNYFANVFKDDQTSDRGYANAISAGDAGAGTTIAVARNVFYDIDHAITLKLDTATIFENNTVHRVHPDFTDGFGNLNIGGAIANFVPGDSAPTAGKGGYVADNIFFDLPRIIANADLPAPQTTTPLEISRNLIDPAIADISVGPAHPGQTVYDLGTGNFNADPFFLDPASGDHRLAQGSPARGGGALGQDLGAMTPPGILITGEPPALTTANNATLTVGGPGIFSYRWKLNDGTYSAILPIGNGFAPPATTVRTATIELAGLADGTYSVTVEGFNFAGWPQESPTVSQAWVVQGSLPGSAQLSEMLAASATGAADFIELHNPGSASISVGGYGISDQPANPFRHSIPAGTTIPPGGYLVIHPPFGLSSSGETVTLTAPGGALIDSLTFGLQIPDLSVARTGRDGAWTLAHPSPGSANLPAATGNPYTLRITEVFAFGDVAFDDDFIEITNPHPSPVALGGLFLTDRANSQPLRYEIPALSFIAPGAAVAFTALPFGLSRSSELVGLSDASGHPIDVFIYGGALADYSLVRPATGTATTTLVRLPTPGVPSGDPGFARALALFDHLRITEIMYDPAQGSDFEFVELLNTGQVPLDLTGLRFTKGIAFSFPNMTLNPGQAVVVVSNLASFHSLYGTGINVAGAYTGNLSNGGEEIVLTLPPPYGAAVLRFRYEDFWFPSTDGGGRSLELAADPAQLRRNGWSLASSWAPSAQDGGTPGGTTTTTLTGFPAWLVQHGITGAHKDEDGDGIPHLMEYALGLHPLVPDPDPLQTFVDAQGRPGISFPMADPASTDTTLAIEASAGLETGGWTAIATKVRQESWTGAAVISGTASNPTATDVSTAVEVTPRRLYRLKATLTPAP